MPGKIFVYSFKDSLISKTADLLLKNSKNKSDFSRNAVIFPGKRPGLFLKKELAGRLNKTFVPPQVFSIEEFIEYIVSKKHKVLRPSFLEEYYLVYNIVKELNSAYPQKAALFEDKDLEKFSDFLPWAKEIVSFLNQLDTEEVEDSSLKNVEKQAGIGFDASKQINKLLANISFIRQQFHKILEEKGIFTPGYMFKKAAEEVVDVKFEEFDSFVFSGFFYLNKSEKKIIKHLFEKRRAWLLFQASTENWQALKDVWEEFGWKQEMPKPFYPQLKILAGFDKISQACLAREALKEAEDIDNTVIVVPDRDMVLPLISEVSSMTDRFNVSLGYPVKRCSLWSLIADIIRAQKTKKRDLYYVKDYLKVILQPWVKNLEYQNWKSPACRIVMHKIEEILLGMVPSRLSGSLFVRLADIEEDMELIKECAAVLEGMGIGLLERDISELIKQTHRLFFYNWENIATFKDLNLSLNGILSLFLERGHSQRHPLNFRLIEYLFDLFEKAQKSQVYEYAFGKDEVFRIFTHLVESEMVPFKGTPLKGLQVLGLFETRTLSFKNVIVVGVNEGVLPRVKMAEPLIPRQAAVVLGIDRLEREEEIQRYHFLRLLGGAEKAFLIYSEADKDCRSRFVEYLLWNIERGRRVSSGIEVVKARFPISTFLKPKGIKKTPQVLKFLEKAVFSASSIDTYVNCPLRFYFQYILGLKPKEDIAEDIESSEIGMFLHKLLEDTFSVFLGRQVDIDRDFEKRFFKEFEKRFEKQFLRAYKSEAFLLKEVMQNRLQKFIKQEAKRKVKIISLEESRQGVFEFDGRRVNFVYIIDRIDEMEDLSLEIIDYKSGADLKSPSPDSLDVESLDRKIVKDKIKSFQLPLYYYFTRQRFPSTNINACLYSLRSLNKQYLFSKKSKVPAEEAMQNYLEGLKFILNEIFNPGVDFSPDNTNEHYCQYCPFFYMCR